MSYIVLLIHVSVSVYMNISNWIFDNCRFDILNTKKAFGVEYLTLKESEGVTDEELAACVEKAVAAIAELEKKIDDYEDDIEDARKEADEKISPSPTKAPAPKPAADPAPEPAADPAPEPAADPAPSST